MTMSIPLSSLESAGSAQFANIGDKHAGRIVAMTERAQTDPVTGQVKTFADGTARMVWVITLEITPGGDTVALWARGGKTGRIAQGTGETMLNAISAAGRAAGASAIDVGGQLAVALTGFSEPTNAGFNPAKLYTAQYQAPAATSIPVDLFSDDK